MMRLPALLLCLLFALPLPTLAGQGCEQREVGAQAIAAAAQTALTVADALDARDAEVALIARNGTDLSRHGLAYSHAGFAVRDHAHGRWTVVHLLNRCGTSSSALHAQGLVNFFADDLVNQDARIVWLDDALAERLARHLIDLPRDSLLNPHYNLIARPGSTRTQNSTAWVLETLAAMQSPQHAVLDRTRAHALAVGHGFQPDVITISYGKRVLGGLFGANVDFNDHPVATRLNGRYPVVTVRSIIRYLEHNRLASAQMEWRNGLLQATPGPG